MKLVIEPAPNGWILKSEPPALNSYSDGLIGVYNEVDDLNTKIKSVLVHKNKDEPDSNKGGDSE